MITLAWMLASGHVAELHRWPVKSMPASPLRRARIALGDPVRIR